jgi:hypothetical protein
VGPPYPALCGSIPLTVPLGLQQGTFVAAKINDDWTVCYITGSDSLGHYLVCDADTEGESIPPVSIHPNNVVALPTMLPRDKKTRLCEYPYGKRVFALWPEKGLWTSVFYPAKVLKTPSQTGSVYKLKFDDGPKTTNVPPGYVFALPLPEDDPPK